MSISFLQSKDWMNFQRSLGRSIFEYDKEGIKVYIARHDIPFGKNYLYIPYGPDMDFNAMTGGIKNPTRNFAYWLKNLAKEQKSIFVKIEPLQDSIAQVLIEQGFKKSKKEIQPSRTIVVDLRKNENELQDKMHHKTRYNIKITQRKNLEFRILNFEEFEKNWDLFKKTSKRDKFYLHKKDYYEKLLSFNFGKIRTFSAGVFMPNSLIAAGIFLIYKDTGYYLHGASDYKYRKLMAPYMLHWQIIKYLKEKGISYYDMWGINARKWPGVTRFKLGWGGKVVEYPGSFDLPIRKFWHFTYKVFQKIRHR